MQTAADEQTNSPAQAVRHYILGTAGHIDHGKSSLVRAMTGTDPDRLPEEKRRGLTIELGFAELVIGDACFGIVDVPGHEKFVRTMVAGATGIDLALLVVAADDSVMPQTVEHFEVLRLLGVSRAVIAVTKTDVVEASLIELVIEEVRELLAGTPLAEAPICPVSSMTGDGLDVLRRAIGEVAGGIAPDRTELPFRMAVDRVFTVQGRGTVVTGSALRGEVRVGDTLNVLPAGATCRVRDLQTHGASRSSLRRGQRAALNLIGVDREQLSRGAELATPGYLQPSNLLDVRLECLESAPRGLKSSRTVRLEIGTSELPVRVVLYGQNVLLPGTSGYAQLRSGEPIASTYGQRFVIRDETAARTVGGGVVLRPHARRRRRDQTDAAAGLSALEIGSPADRVAEVVSDAGFDRPTDLQVCARAGVSLAEVPDLLAELERAGRWVRVAGTDVMAAPQVVEGLCRRLVSWLERYHRSHPELPGRPVESVLGWIERVTRQRALPRPLLDAWADAGRVKRFGRFICSPAFAPSLSAADEKLLAGMCEEIRGGGFSPPTLDELTRTRQVDRKRLARLATLAAAMGELVPVDATILLHAETEERLRATVGGLIDARGGVTVSEVREALGSSRKFVVPFLEYLDRVGFTQRDGDRRTRV